jgi:hypothetical protein
MAGPALALACAASTMPGPALANCGARGRPSVWSCGRAAFPRPNWRVSQAVLGTLEAHLLGTSRSKRGCNYQVAAPQGDQKMCVEFVDRQQDVSGCRWSWSAPPLDFSFLVPELPRPLAVAAEINMSCSASLPVCLSGTPRGAQCLTAAPDPATGATAWYYSRRLALSRATAHAKDPPRRL